MTYRRWDDLVGSDDKANLLIAEVDPGTELGGLRDLIGGLRPAGDFAVRAKSERHIQIAFEKPDDLARIGGLVGATCAPEPTAKATFKYNSKAQKSAEKAAPTLA